MSASNPPRPPLHLAFEVVFNVEVEVGKPHGLTPEALHAVADRSGAEDALANAFWTNDGPGVHLDHARVVLARVDTIETEPPKRITSIAGFIDALGDAVEYGKLPGVLGLDDEGANYPEGEDGPVHLFSLLLNDDEETRIHLAISDLPWVSETAPTRAPRRAREVPRG